MFSEPLTILVLGETGAGKSSFCNIITGEKHDSIVFPVSKSNVSVTHETTIKLRFFKGDQSRPIRVIDTQGFLDPGSTIFQEHADLEIKAELFTRLGDVDGIHLFIICVNAANPRIPPSLVRMIKTFISLYGYRIENEDKISNSEEFWKRCVLNFTKFSFNEESTRHRRRTRESKSRLKLKTQDKLEGLFGFAAQGLKHFFIDSLYSKDNPEELKRFEEETERLYQFLLTKSAERKIWKKLGTFTIVITSEEYRSGLYYRLCIFSILSEYIE